MPENVMENNGVRVVLDRLTKTYEVRVAGGGAELSAVVTVRPDDSRGISLAGAGINRTVITPTEIKQIAQAFYTLAAKIEEK